MVISPFSTFKNPSIHLKNVVFPIPFAPKIDNVSPFWTSKDKFLKRKLSFSYAKATFSTLIIPYTPSFMQK